jgi:endogenous inhibitor of DNA gyrase (YacG/DUF329 family)
MAAKPPPRVHCPTCRKKVVWSPASRWRPFCSERCKLIDLGEWLEENHRISEPAALDVGAMPDWDEEFPH